MTTSRTVDDGVRHVLDHLDELASEALDIRHAILLGAVAGLEPLGRTVVEGQMDELSAIAMTLLEEAEARRWRPDYDTRSQDGR